MCPYSGVMDAEIAPPTDSSEEQRWQELLAGLDISDLSRAFLTQLTGVDEYAAPRIPIAQIRLDADESFRGLIAALATNDPTPTIEIATRVGVTRARAGIPLASLMSAIQLDFNVLWNQLLGLKTPSDETLLLHRANSVWKIVDMYVRQTQQAYLLEERRMSSELESQRRALVAELLGDHRLLPRRIDEIADQLDLEPDGEYSVAVGFAAAVADLRVEVASCERHGHRVLAMYRGGGLIVVRPAGPHAEHERMRELRVGLVEPVAGLASVSGAAKLASELGLAIGADESGAMTLLRGWTRLVRRRTAEPHLDRLFDFEDALDGCSAVERSHLETCVRSYLRTGSISTTAGELYCHRNTVTNRLRRFTELTGVDVTVPEQAARVVVAWS